MTVIRWSGNGRPTEPVWPFQPARIKVSLPLQNYLLHFIAELCCIVFVRAKLFAASNGKQNREAIISHTQAVNSTFTFLCTAGSSNMRKKIIIPVVPAVAHDSVPGATMILMQMRGIQWVTRYTNSYQMRTASHISWKGSWGQFPSSLGSRLRNV